MTKRIPDSKRKLVREMCLSGLTPDAVQHRFGYSLETISRIVNNRNIPLPERISNYIITPEELSRLMIKRMYALNMTQTGLAKRTGYSQASINHFYNGKRVPKDDSKLLLLFHALNIESNEYRKNSDL